MSLPTVAVIGGGISGLAAAHRLRELQNQSQKFNIVLLEAGPRLGGIVESERVNGFLLEKGPDAFLREKPWAWELAARLGLDDQLIGTRQEARQTFIVRQNRLIPVPEGFYLISPVKIGPFLRSELFSVPGKLRILAEPFVPPRRDEEQESLADFVRRRFGRECLERAGQPMLAGIYTGDPEKLGIISTLGRFHELEKRHGSVLLGLRREKKDASLDKASGPRYGLFVSFKNGMQTLTDALEKTLPADAARLNTAARGIRYDGSGKMWHILTSGETVQAQAVVCALPARAASAVFRQNLTELSAELSQLNYESVATLHLAYEKKQLTRLPKGFGFVTPKTEKKAVIACTFVDQKFEGRAPRDFCLFRAFVGGAFGREYLAESDAGILATAEKELGQLFGIRTEAVFKRLQRHPDSMVQYSPGHRSWLGRVNRLAGAFPGLFLTGASYAGVGLPDCVRDAEMQAQEAGLFLNPIRL